MTYVVLSGPFQGPPDSVFGPFESRDDADDFAISAAGDPENRFAAVMVLTTPGMESNADRDRREADDAATQRETDAELGGEA